MLEEDFEQLCYQATQNILQSMGWSKEQSKKIHEACEVREEQQASK